VRWAVIWNWLELLVWRHEFARYMRQDIAGVTWGKALSYHTDPAQEKGDPIEAAQRELAKMRSRRNPYPMRDPVADVATVGDSLLNQQLNTGHGPMNPLISPLMVCIH
jgi:hypothetical protein